MAGLAFEGGEPGQALGALLLFGTNVTAIIATGVLLLLLGGFQQAAREAGHPIGRLRGSTLALVGGSVALVAIPLGIGSYQVTREQVVLRTARPVVQTWADGRGWTLTDLAMRQSVLHVAALGQSTKPTIDDLRAALDAAGLADIELAVDYSLGGTLRAPN